LETRGSKSICGGWHSYHKTWNPAGGTAPTGCFCICIRPKEKGAQGIFKKRIARRFGMGFIKKQRSTVSFGVVLELDLQEVVNNTNQDEGAIKFHPQGPKPSILKHVFFWIGDRKVRKM
jgi:hypothetical protein